MTRITFDTTPYELTHGRSPRGRGSWVFRPFHLRNADSLEGMLMSPSMTLTEAKRWAKAEIARRYQKRLDAGLKATPWNSELWAVLG